MKPRSSSWFAATTLIVSLAAPTLAQAQRDAGTSPDAGAAVRRTSLASICRRPTAPRDEIIGWDPIQAKLLVVERMPSELVGFAHVALTEISEAGPGQRVWLTTATDIQSIRSATDPLGVSAQIDARVRNDIAAARSRVSAGAVIPISEPVGACSRAPFQPHTISLEEGRTVTTTVSPDGMSTTIVLSQGNRPGPSITLPSATLNTQTGVIPLPFNRLMDLRELPGTDRLAALVRSDACLPEGEVERVKAVLLQPFPVGEQPLNALARVALDERAAMRALAPRARYRTRDGQAGYFDGTTRVVFNAAWATPDGKLLVQYTRRPQELSPLLSEQGHAQARVVVVEQRGSRLIPLHEVVPPLNEDVFEGLSQEAFAADMDADGHPELFIRSRYNPEGEVTSMFRWADGALQYMWRAQTRVDERSIPPGTTAEVRQCTVGVEGQMLVMRCRVEKYPANAGRNALPVAVERVIQRVRSNGGAVSITTERR